MDSTWTTLGILLAGVIVVIGGVLVLRLHAFLALILGALLVAALTPESTIERQAIEQDSFRIIDLASPDDDLVTMKLDRRQWTQPGMPLVVLRPSAAEPGGFEQIAELRVERVHDETLDDRKETRAVARVIRRSRTDATISTEDIAIAPADLRAAGNLARQTIGERVARGFGSTAGKIGILIAMASIIGICLLESGAADRIVRTLLGLMGERGAPASFLSSGFLLGIPVFFDTVFYLMIPLGKAMRMRTGRNYLLYVLTIVAGATMAHSLVPPTPGPLFVAEELGVEIGTMILAGCVVGLFTAGFGYFYAGIVSRIWDLPLRESAELSLEDLEAITHRDESELPSFGLSLLPIVLPVVLIGGYTVLKSFAADIPDDAMRVAQTLGDKNIALVIAAAIAMTTLVRQKRTTRAELARSVQAALASGGVIILITSAGGAFGAALQQTGVAGLIREMPQASPVMIVTLAFLITAAIRTAQGSATVAMITAVGILGGLAASGELAFHPVWLALAIGCGSKPVAWMNDSGFWVITKMSGMTEAEGLKYVTPMTTLMGLVGLGVVIAGVVLFPML